MISVPLEPTEAMLQGACDKHRPGQPMSDRPGGDRECPRFETRQRIWASMLAAAPSPAGGQELRESVERVQACLALSEDLERRCPDDEIAGLSFVSNNDLRKLLAALSHPVSGGGDHGALAPLVPTAQAETPVVDWSAPPYAPNGWGGQLQAAIEEYLGEYVLCTEGADYEPTDNERFLLNDCIAGLLVDDRFDGILRQMVAHPAPAEAPSGGAS